MLHWHHHSGATPIVASLLDDYSAGNQKQGGTATAIRVIKFAAILLALAAVAARPARAEDLQKVTIAFAGGGGFYKQEGSSKSVDASSGTRQAAAVMGGSAEITQVGFAHTMHAVGRGGALVGIATAFDVYPIALVRRGSR